MRSYLVPQCWRVLSAIRRRREDDHVHFGVTGPRRFPSTGFQDPAAHLGYDSAHRQLPAIYVCQQRGRDRVHGHHYQLVFSHAQDAPDARLDPCPFSQLSAARHSDEAAAAR